MMKLVFFVAMQLLSGSFTTCEGQSSFPTKIATQPNTWGTSTANRAIDGNISTCSLSAIGSEALLEYGWWQVDLGDIFTVYSVNVTSGSHDGSDPRYDQNFAISVGMTNDVTAIDSNIGLCYYFNNGSHVSAGIPTTFTCAPSPLNGRYVTIKRRGGYRQDAMGLCEVGIQYTTLSSASPTSTLSTTSSSPTSTSSATSNPSTTSPSPTSTSSTTSNPSSTSPSPTSTSPTTSNPSTTSPSPTSTSSTTSNPPVTSSSPTSTSNSSTTSPSPTSSKTSNSSATSSPTSTSPTSTSSGTLLAITTSSLLTASTPSSTERYEVWNDPATIAAIVLGCILGLSLIVILIISIMIHRLRKESKKLQSASSEPKRASDAESINYEAMNENDRPPSLTSTMNRNSHQRSSLYPPLHRDDSVY